MTFNVKSAAEGLAINRLRV